MEWNDRNVDEERQRLLRDKVLGRNKEPLRLLVTGARAWSDEVSLRQYLNAWLWTNPTMILVHGDCPTGADAMASKWARDNNVPEEKYPADWNKHGKPAGHIRNKQMVDTSPDVAIAFIQGESRGTNNCLGHIRKAGIPHYVFRAE
jgi:hypothetical protein